MRSWLIKGASFLVQMAAFVAYLAASPDGWRVYLALLCLAVGGFIASFVHECGHVVAALACRWRIVTFVVRPIGFQLPNRNLAIIPKGYNDGAGGWVSPVPRLPEADTKRNWAIILAAGPIASLLLAAFALFVWPGAGPAQGGGLSYGPLGAGLALQALHGFLFSLLPGHRPGQSDGDQLRALARDETYERRRPLVSLATLLGSNVRLRDLPEWVLTEAHAVAAEHEGAEQYLAGTEIGRVLDGAPVDAGRARSMIEAYRAAYGTSDWLADCDAWLAAIWEGDPRRAEAALAAHGTALALTPLTMAAEAALAAASGEAALARARLDAMDAAVKRDSPFPNPTFRDIRRQVETLLP